ncbi:MAG: type II secretion system major pseudopilin GspG [Synergistaceae bacterium]|nr:type II secretion system major pseudopilin GspG [Synergistaceae bacterium]MBQ3694761.1 type II secretion system major pseudopilin GspG [Synergistaceae bacterium]MBQ9629167.1 type II secretion system major pseudopilin GspG [Synergistaceae bacterium]MBR0069457.1 type II secretion system major pseudopilin GspG [Synergistaceae bacterium]MBR0250051.1 type II secretion system major pseudopilin GspG [Synergistaceae bacterium]
MKDRKKILMRRRSGFTLIEIMVVVVILGLLAALVVPRIGPQVAEAQRTTAATQIRSLEDALEMYRMHNGFYPSTQQGLEALVTPPTTSPVPKRFAEGGYIKKVPDDPWGNPYVYRNNNGRITITSYGPDGEEGGEGINADITNED